MASLTPEAADDEADRPLLDTTLFLSTDYVERTFAVAGLSQPLLCSTAAATEPELTGQIVWPASQLLATFVAAAPEKTVAGRVVLELGAGCGLAGLLAARVGAKRVLLTDGSAVIVSLLRSSLSRSAVASGLAGKASAHRLEWGSEAAVAALSAEVGADVLGSLDVVLAADVFHPSFGLPALLFRTVRCLIGRREGSALYASFAVRAAGCELEIRDAAAVAGFRPEEVPLSSFLPADTPPDSFSRQQLRLFKFTVS